MPQLHPVTRQLISFAAQTNVCSTNPGTFAPGNDAEAAFYEREVQRFTLARARREQMPESYDFSTGAVAMAAVVEHTATVLAFPGRPRERRNRAGRSCARSVTAEAFRASAARRGSA